MIHNSVNSEKITTSIKYTLRTYILFGKMCFENLFHFSLVRIT